MLLFGDVDDVDVGVWTMDVIPDLKQNHIHVSADIICVCTMSICLSGFHFTVFTWIFLPGAELV